MRGLRKGLNGLFVICGASIVAPHLVAAGNYEVPVPSGHYMVGRTTMHIVDESRTDASGSHPSKKREFMLVVWYPAEVAENATRAPWFSADWAALEANGLLGLQLS